MTLRVAVIGVSGIGKHHAKWYHRWGCEVAGFVGTTEESCARNEEELRRLFPFTGCGYTDLTSLIDGLAPDIIDVCSPNEMHFEHVSTALDAGCHVLCEKPLVWNNDSAKILKMQACQLVERAEKAKKILAVCTQYAFAMPQYNELYHDIRGGSVSGSVFSAEMETVARGRVRNSSDIWVDMGSHPLSLLLSLHPDGRVKTNSLNTHFGSGEARVEFDFETSTGNCCVDIVVRDRQEGSPTRRFGVDGFIVDFMGRPDEFGVYRSVLSRDSDESVGEDFMSLLIKDFCSVVSGERNSPVVSGEVGLRNLELQLQVMKAIDSATL